MSSITSLQGTILVADDNESIREALSQEKTLEIMWEETRRGWWDADLVSALEGLLAESPLVFSAVSA